MNNIVDLQQRRELVKKSKAQLQAKDLLGALGHEVDFSKPDKLRDRIVEILNKYN